MKKVRNEKKIMTFGETMLRFSPENYKRFGQADRFQMFFGGAEANVAVSLSYMGFQTGYVTKLPENEMADAAIRYLNGFQVDTGNILRGGKRMGLFFMEQGASLRPGIMVIQKIGLVSVSPGCGSVLLYPTRATAKVAITAENADTSLSIRL